MFLYSLRLPPTFSMSHFQELSLWKLQQIFPSCSPSGDRPFPLTITQYKDKCKHHYCWDKYNAYAVQQILIKSKKFLTDLISGNGYLTSSFARQMHPLPKKAEAKP